MLRPLDTLPAAGIVAGTLSALLTAPALADTLAVEPGGAPGTFAEIQAAVDAATPGDTILVAAGLYEPITVDKRLSILGEGENAVLLNGQSRVSETAQIRLAGMHFKSLTLNDIDGNSAIVDCKIGPLGPDAALLVVDCRNVLVDRCEIRGVESFFPGEPFGSGALMAEGAGVRCESSEVYITRSRIEGGDGGSGSSGFYIGKTGLEVDGGTVIVTNSSIFGGEGGTFFGPFGSTITDPGGDGIVVSAGELILRGNGLFELGAPDGVLNYVFGGKGGESHSQPGTSMVVMDGADVWTSGVFFDNPAAGPFTELAVAEPLTVFALPTQPDDPWTLNVYGERGLPLVLALGVEIAVTDLPGFFGPLWVPVAPTTVLLGLAGAGQSTALTFDLALPEDTSSLLGVELVAQVFAPTLTYTTDPSSSFASNPTAILLR